MSQLKELAQRFVEDDLSAEEQQRLVAQAAEYVRSERKVHNGNTGAPAMELALSIQRWMSKDDPDDDVGDVDKNAKAHAFVARTLKALPTDSLKAKEVQVFATFFGSMYTIGGNSWPVATEALSTLTSMISCNTSAVDGILSNMADIDPDDFTKQLAKTRADLLLLFAQLLHGGISEARQKADSILKVLKLAVRERDPNNLLRWFGTLSSIMRATKLTERTADALFESFSPFFPISIRASSSNGKAVSEPELKDALRSCFAANGQLARRTVPFLLGKLDDGTTSMTASVKLDILETIRACAEGYEPCDTHVVPHIPQIWSSLKYEVRNGEAPEAIQATLAVFEALSRRLADDSSPKNLNAFIESIWKDSVEDLIDNPTYTEQAGSILISVARAHVASFRLISPALIQSIQQAINQPKSPAHAKSLLLVLNNLLRVRRQLASSLSVGTLPETDADPPVSLLRAIFFKILNENAVDDPNGQQLDLAEEALLGLEQIVKQRRPRGDAIGYTTDCDEDALREIRTVLSFRYLNCFNRRAPNAGSSQQGLESAVGKTLLALVQAYPRGYGKIVSDVLDDVMKINWTNIPAKRSRAALSLSCLRLAYLGCAIVPEDAAAIVNFAAFAGGMLKMLGALFACKANLAICASVAAAILKGVRLFVAAEQVRSQLDDLKKADIWEQSWDVSSIDDAVKAVLPNFPDLATGHFLEFDPKSLMQFLPSFGQQEFVFTFLQLSISIVRQLYQHATTKVQNVENTELDLSVALTSGLIDFDGQSSSNAFLWRDRYLNIVGSIAAAVLSELNLSAQNDLVLHEQILACFRPSDSASRQLYWEYHRSAVLGELSWGIAHAIRPEVVLNLHGDIGRLLVKGPDKAGRSFVQQPSRIASIATLLANKYDIRTPKPVHEAQQKHEVWIQVLTNIEDLLKDPTVMANMPVGELSTVTGILWGATSRGDRFVTKGLQNSIGHAAVKSNDIARQLATIFLPLKRCLCPAFTPAYLVSKPLSGQRAYVHCVRPVLSDAYPVAGENEGSISLAIYVLHSAKQLDVAQYEQDADKIFRIAVTAMTKAKYVEDLDAAATIVHHIICNRTALAKQYWDTVLDAERAMYNNAHPFQSDTRLAATSTNDPWMRNSSTRPETEGDLTALRKKALRLSALVAQSMRSPEPLHSLQRSRSLIVKELRHLTTASGDKIREIRALVLQTRGHWLHVETPAMQNED
ncbi:unnamed protein product [Discula destructiva]